LQKRQPRIMQGLRRPHGQPNRDLSRLAQTYGHVYVAVVPCIVIVTPLEPAGVHVPVCTYDDGSATVQSGSNTNPPPEKLRSQPLMVGSGTNVVLAEHDTEEPGGHMEEALAHPPPLLLLLDTPHCAPPPPQVMHVAVPGGQKVNVP
jgi:hypothetical protein